MQTTRTDAENRALAATKRAFEHWRARRPRGERIPDELWAKAVAAAETHGVSRAATTLRLDYYALKRRLGDDHGECLEDSDVAATFVELPLRTSAPTISCTIEIDPSDAPDGVGRTRLRIECDAITPADLSTLVSRLQAPRA
jgi:hypothetical protein